jgi:hypothetical protein
MLEAFPEVEGREHESRVMLSRLIVTGFHQAVHHAALQKYDD